MKTIDMENSQKAAFAMSLSPSDKHDGVLQEGLTKREYISVRILSNMACSYVNHEQIKTDVEFALKYTDELLKQLDNER